MTWRRPVQLGGILADAVVVVFQKALAATPSTDVAIRLLYRQAQRGGLRAEDVQLLLERAHPGACEFLVDERPERVELMRREYLVALIGPEIECAVSSAVHFVMLRAGVEEDLDAGALIPDYLAPVVAAIRADRKPPLSPELVRAVQKNTPAPTIDLNHVRARLRALARRRKKSKKIDSQLVGYVVGAILDGVDVALYRVAPDETRQLATDSRGAPIDASRAIAMAMPSIGAALGKSVPFHALLEIARGSLLASATDAVPFDALVAKARRAYAPAQAHRLVADVKRAQRDEATRLRRARLVARRHEAPKKKKDNE